jgi:hypothetical protein
MRRSRNWDGKASLNRDSSVEGEKLHCDLSLVMVHRYDSVKVLPLEENGITRERPLYINAQFTGSCDCRTDVINLLSSKGPIFSVMRVQGTDTQARGVDSRLPSILISVFCLFKAQGSPHNIPQPM